MNKKTLLNPKGAGRRKLSDKDLRWIRRTARESIPKHTPVHVTVKIKPKIVRTLRTKLLFKKFKLALKRARHKGIRILHFSIQGNHIHMLIEARNKRELAKGMQSFSISLAMSLKHHTKNKRKGIFRDRYHVRILKTLQDVRNVMNYIAKNGYKHRITATQADTYSSGILMKHLRLDFSHYFKEAKRLKEFKEKLKQMTDPPQFWLSMRLA